jgi:hypothetical protein
VARTTIRTGDITDSSVTAAKLASTAITDKLGYTPLQASDLNNYVTLTGTATLTNKTAQNLILTGTLTAGGGIGTSGQYLQSTGSGIQWTTISVPTVNTFTNIAIAGQNTVSADGANDTLTIVAGTGITLSTDSSTDTITITGNATTNTFVTVAVAGQTNVVADTTSDTLTLVAGSNVTITTDPATDSITISSTDTLSNSFSTISVSGHSNVVADSNTDTLTLVASSGIDISTNAITDAITFTNTGVTSVNGLTGSVSAQNILDAVKSLDGPNSGLDADTLDGNDGSYYQQALGYTPVNKAGDTMTGNLTLVGSPTNSLHAATKEYVDSVAAGLNWKSAVNLLAVTNVPLSGNTNTLIIDGHSALVAANDGYRILLKNQTNATNNGIYTYSDNGTTYTLSRSSDADTYQELDGTSVLVLEGATYALTGWVQTNHYLTSFSGQNWVQFNAGGGGTGGITSTVDKFTGNGTTTQFTLSVTPANEDHTLVVMEGVVQFKDTYSISGNVITFSSAPYNTYAIEVTTFANTVVNTFSNVAVAGQTSIVADSPSDTLTFEAGSGIAITTTAGTDTIAFAVDNTVATLTGSQTLTNKTLTSPVLGGTTTSASGNVVFKPATNILEVQGDGVSVDGQIQLNCHVNSHGQKIASQPHSQAATNKLLLPGGTTIGNADAVLVSDTGTQTLTNKTLTSPTINSATANNLTLTGTLTANAGVGAAGQVLKSTGTGVQWANESGGSSFSTITVAGQNNVVADSASDTLTIVAGTGITITTDDTADSITITGNATSNTFSTIAVSGQSNIVADSTTDTLTFVAGDNVTITTNATTDTITISSTGGGNVGSGEEINRTVDNFTATANQTTFTASGGYIVGNIDVYMNGIRLITGVDYTASNGTTVVLTTGASAGSVIQLISWRFLANTFSPFLLMGA